jgi:hypothetical protein
MKTSKLFLFFLLPLIGFSCEKNDKQSVLTDLKGQYGFSFNQSLNIWNDFKNKNGNSYSYTTTVGSWTGYGSTTEFKIEEGVIISRTYQRFKINGQDGTKEILESYNETGDGLGTHSKGASLLTIDDLYEACANKYLMADQKSNALYFETSKDGLMTSCGFVPNGCMDDCFQGVIISSVDWPQ